ncbi:hypothetical protein ILYODFUR_038639 [Ilyodon furcidens]|uniref:Uncharacterized protein n=1 Tax=Ilyodon furcidens TaxID=33524 RepID=A0ABV0UQG7_9TELE
MGKTQKSASMTTPASTYPRSECSASTSTISPEKSYADVLDSIDKKLPRLDARLTLVEVLHKEFSSSEGISGALLTAKKQTLRDKVKKCTDGMMQLSETKK